MLAESNQFNIHEWLWDKAGRNSPAILKSWIAFAVLLDKYCKRRRARRLEKSLLLERTAAGKLFAFLLRKRPDLRSVYREEFFMMGPQPASECVAGKEHRLLIDHIDDLVNALELPYLKVESGHFVVDIPGHLYDSWIKLDCLGYQDVDDINYIAAVLADLDKEQIKALAEASTPKVALEGVMTDLREWTNCFRKVFAAPHLKFEDFDQESGEASQFIWAAHGKLDSYNRVVPAILSDWGDKRRRGTHDGYQKALDILLQSEIDQQEHKEFHLRVRRLEPLVNCLVACTTFCRHAVSLGFGVDLVKAQVKISSFKEDRSKLVTEISKAEAEFDKSNRDQRHSLEGCKSLIDNIFSTVRPQQPDSLRQLMPPSLAGLYSNCRALGDYILELFS